jgi:hypothetical protein
VWCTSNCFEVFFAGASTYLQVTLEQFDLHHHARAAASNVEAENNDEEDEKDDHERRDHGLPLASRPAGPISQTQQYQQTQHYIHPRPSILHATSLHGHFCHARLGMFFKLASF